MSFESGRKLGLTASLIAVIMPVIGVITAIFLVLSLLAGTLSTLFNFESITILLAIAGIITFAGFILFLVAMHSLSQYYSESGIFKNVLYGFIINIVGAAIAVSIELAIIVTSIVKIAQGAGTGTADPSAIQFIILFLSCIRGRFHFGNSKCCFLHARLQQTWRKIWNQQFQNRWVAILNRHCINDCRNRGFAIVDSVDLCRTRVLLS